VRLQIVVVGRAGRGALAAAAADFEARAARYWPLDVREVRAEVAKGRSSDTVRKREGERILAAAGGGILIACEERGTTMHSLEFARWLQQLRERAQTVSFAIGGAFGLDDAVRSAAGTLLALAPWTLSHELARLVLAEQLYRAGTIVRGEPYHK
jgi:23S rRNA (pseudouridine1915-N3)-methyltransferase